MIILCNNVIFLLNKDFLKLCFYLIWLFYKGFFKNYVNEIEFSNIWNIYNVGIKVCVLYWDNDDFFFC